MSLVIKMLMTYMEAEKEYGSAYKLKAALKLGELSKLDNGLYSDSANVSPFALISKKYPFAVITKDSAFYIHGLTDVIPQKAYLATKRNATRIVDSDVVQVFLKDNLFLAGVELTVYDNTEIRIYNKERMLVEAMRNSKTMPFDYYKEIIANYRKQIANMDIRKIEDYIELFKRKDYLYEVLQREVL
jgi:predicted transcriptional regulator of viral defense system